MQRHGTAPEPKRTRQRRKQTAAMRETTGTKALATVVAMLLMMMTILLPTRKNGSVPCFSDAFPLRSAFRRAQGLSAGSPGPHRPRNLPQIRNPPFPVLPASPSGRNDPARGKATDPSKQQQQKPHDTKPKPPDHRWTSRAAALALPALIGMLADPLLSVMDTVCVGRLSASGTRDLAALGACTSLFHLAFNAFRATTAATTSLVGKSSDEHERRQIVQISLNLGLLLGLGVVVFLRVFGPWCLGCMGVPGSSPLFGPSRAYLFTRSPAAPAVLAATVAEGAFRGYGDTRIPLLASGVAALLNAVLDPVLMLPPFSMGVRGAALATAVAQFGALGVYLVWLRRRRMLPREALGAASPGEGTRKRKVVATILGANLAMVGKQGSLLLAWAFATSRATRIGPAHVAAHQVGLSVWLVLALIQDGAGVAAQVLLAGVLKEAPGPAQTRERDPCRGDTGSDGSTPWNEPRAAAPSASRYQTARSLVAYMLRFSVLQGIAATAVLLLAAPFLPGCFVPAAAGGSSRVVRDRLVELLPHVALQQLLVGPTLVAEALAAGGGRFGLLAAGTACATGAALWQLGRATTVATIWSRGIVTLFAGRLLTALVGTALVLRECQKEEPEPAV
ncbi:unnamed protein product [Pseudo-nitzschia multistriata]|uniref:Polysaccharide biosynthesis protein C-terminal domain-containing protein n=1 Tax=Pseudo-nitzschia multistriata TaxID=183589 RepID=A0A448ZDT7_9STRA|nr:unnamed protein product [Pseudo-nitzschia multistriata]